ncbi:MAG: cob(I)yrinic acid a,c-diamide adenosyltransferase [Candidatus Cloacimonetes bacterium]|nr:cob(I)yrinic acid a,c-diamide adenosyltransferase [Candidatus Cloacimonadota bacterium]
MIHVYTGNGKGKTTAALGLIMRSLGYDRQICLVQFMKPDDTWGEIRFLDQQSGVMIFQFGADVFVDPENVTELDRAEAKEAADKAEEALTTGGFNLVVLDEINVAAAWGVLPVERQLALMEMAGDAELVMTGRYAMPEVIARADLVTEMREVRHYYEREIPARKGIEY